MRQFINVTNLEVSAQKMPDEMHRRIFQTIDSIQRRYMDTADLAGYAPAPERLRIPRGKSFGFVVPKSEVQFHGRRSGRIIVVSAPRPASLANHHRQVIDRLG